MARQFNGSSDKATATIDLSSYSSASASFWLWADSISVNNSRCFAYDTDPANDWGAWTATIKGTTADSHVYFSTQSGLYWVDYFTPPSAGAWHHWLVACNRASPTNFVWIDGVAVTFTSTSHAAGAYGNFANAYLSLMVQLPTPVLAGRMAEFALWGGTVLSTSDAKTLAAGAPPHYVEPGSLIYAPLFGADSPEPDYSGNRRSVTLTGTSFKQHPPVMPGVIQPSYAFEDRSTADVLTTPVGVFDPQLVPKGWF